MGDSTFSKFTVAVFQEKNAGTTLSDLQKKTECDVFEISSFGDFVSFLKKIDVSSLEYTDTNAKKSFDAFLNSIDSHVISSETDNPSGQLQRSYKRAPKTIHDIEKQHIIKTLQLCKWKYKTTAQALGINRTTLYRKMKKYNISPASMK